MNCQQHYDLEICRDYEEEQIKKERRGNEISPLKRCIHIYIYITIKFQNRLDNIYLVKASIIKKRTNNQCYQEMIIHPNDK